MWKKRIHRKRTKATTRTRSRVIHSDDLIALSSRRMRRDQQESFLKQGSYWWFNPFVDVFIGFFVCLSRCPFFSRWTNLVKWIGLRQVECVISDVSKERKSFFDVLWIRRVIGNSLNCHLSSNRRQELDQDVLQVLDKTVEKWMWTFFFSQRVTEYRWANGRLDWFEWSYLQSSQWISIFGRCSVVIWTEWSNHCLEWLRENRRVFFLVVFWIWTGSREILANEERAIDRTHHEWLQCFSIDVAVRWKHSKIDVVLNYLPFWLGRRNQRDKFDHSFLLNHRPLLEWKGNPVEGALTTVNKIRARQSLNSLERHCLASRSLSIDVIFKEVSRLNLNVRSESHCWHFSRRSGEWLRKSFESSSTIWPSRWCRLTKEIDLTRRRDSISAIDWIPSLSSENSSRCVERKGRRGRLIDSKRLTRTQQWRTNRRIRGSTVNS